MVTFNGVEMIVHDIIMRVWCSSVTATMLAMVKLASGAAFMSIEYVTDFPIIYDAFYFTKADLLCDIRVIVATILGISSHLHHVYFNHVPHQFNTFSDVVAKIYLRGLLPSNSCIN